MSCKLMHSSRNATISRPSCRQEKRNVNNLSYVKRHGSLRDVNRLLRFCVWNAQSVRINIHVDVPDDPDAIKFLDLLDSLGLAQHVKTPTHRCGHTLDLIITREINST